jgi:hypothetical protein
MVTSILHELVLIEFRAACPPIKDNMKHLSVEDKILPRTQGPLKYEPDPQDPVERKKIRTLVEPMIFPVYNSKEMELIFTKETAVIFSNSILVG